MHAVLTHRRFWLAGSAPLRDFFLAVAEAAAGVEPEELNADGSGPSMAAVPEPMPGCLR